MTGLLSSKFLELHTTWQGMTAISIAQQNGHKKIKEMILVRGEMSLKSVIMSCPGRVSVQRATPGTVPQTREAFSSPCSSSSVLSTTSFSSTFSGTFFSTSTSPTTSTT